MYINKGPVIPIDRMDMSSKFGRGQNHDRRNAEETVERDIHRITGKSTSTWLKRETGIDRGARCESRLVPASVM